MPDRRTQILALLDTRHDHLPQPVRHTVATAGFVHRTLAPHVCPTCDGVDPKCPDCRGRGEIEVARNRDPYATDRVSPYGIEATHKLGHVPARDAEISRLANQTATVVSELDAIQQANLHPYGWELERRRMYARYDYRALDVALERLNGLIDPHSPQGLQLLDRWLPDPLRAPEPAATAVRVKGRAALNGQLARRDREICRLAQTMPVQWIAAEYGIAVSTVYAIAKHPRNRP